MSETALKRAILDALRTLGVEAWNSPAGLVKVRRAWLHLAPEGTADIVGYLPDGRFLGLEVKAPRAGTAPERREKQAAWRERARRAGCVVAEVRSVDEAVAVVVAAANDAYRLRLRPIASSMPTSPAARMAVLQDLLAPPDEDGVRHPENALISRADARRLMDAVDDGTNAAADVLQTPEVTR